MGLGDKLSIGSGSGWSDDFNDGVITGWTDIGEDNLSESSGTIRQTSATSDSHYSIDDGAAWTDYTVTCDIMAKDNDENGTSFRVQDANNYYVLYQRFGQGGPNAWGLYLRKYVAGTPTDLAAPIDQSGSVSEDVWYELKVELSGNNIKCYFDGVPMFDVNDSTFSDGTAGIWGLSQECRWDNMVVATGAAGSDFHIQTRDSDTQVTVQETAGTTKTNQSYTIERACNTMQDWEDDREGDLVAAGSREVGVCYNDGAFTDRLVISGSVTDAARYMAVTVADGERHNGIKNSGAVIDALGGWAVQNAIDVEDEYTRIEGLEIKAIHDAGDGISFANSPSSANGFVSDVYVHSFWQASNAAVRVDTTGVTIRNCFITGGTTYGVYIEVSAGVTIENCTLWGSSGGGYGVYTAAGDVAIKNTISVDHGTLDFYIASGTATISYFGNNMYLTYGGGFDPATEDGGNQTPPANLEWLFVSIDSTENLHLEPYGHRAGNLGLDLSSVFTKDIDGTTRTVAWGIGADEGVSGTQPLMTRLIRWSEVEP